MNGPSDDELRRALRGLADVPVPTSIVPAVMRRVSRPEPASAWSWLVRRRKFELRLSPLSVLAGVGAVALVIGAFQTVSQRRDRVALAPVAHAPEESTHADVVVVRFVLSAKGARRVAVAGDFNGWDAAATVLEPIDTSGTFVAAVPLRRGAYEYMFVVDGQWLTDPTAAERRPDGFGRTNGVLRL